jgi:hypothetical protein
MVRMNYHFMILFIISLGISTQSTSSGKTLFSSKISTFLLTLLLVVVKVAALDQEIIDRLKASVLSISRFNEVEGQYEIIATAMVWDYTNDKVLILANYHTFANIEFQYCFPPDKKKKRKVTEDPVKLKFCNESEIGFSYEFDLTSDLFFRWKEEEDFVVLRLPSDGFTLPRIPINLATTLTMKIHAFGYIGHLQSFNITGGEIAGYLAEGFTMNLLSAPGYSGAAIIADGYGRAVGFMGGNYDSSDKKNSQHQSYAFKFDQVILSTNRQNTPTSSPGK